MTTATLQYQLEIKNGESIQEVGNFFKANPFQVVLSDITLDVRLIHDDHKEVVYEVKSADKTIVHLEHPDFTPECAPSEVTSHVSLTQIQAETFFAALIHLGVSKGHWKAHTEANKSSYSFAVKQPYFL